MQNGIQLVIILVVAATVDRFGRRNICCGGLSTMLIAVTLIGILGVVPKSDATNKLLVFFSCVYSAYALDFGWGHRADRQSSDCNALDRRDGDSSASSRPSVSGLTRPASLPQFRVSVG